MPSFNRAVYEVIKASFSEASKFFYGSPNRASKIFYTMLPVSPDPEQPVLLCETQGGQGTARIQFSVSAGGNAGIAEDLLKVLQELVSDIEGGISYTDSSGTYTYDIWNNVTEGVRTIGGADLNTWDAIFETEFWWNRTS